MFFRWAKNSLSIYSSLYSCILSPSPKLSCPHQRTLDRGGGLSLPANKTRLLLDCVTLSLCCCVVCILHHSYVRTVSPKKMNLRTIEIKYIQISTHFFSSFPHFLLLETPTLIIIRALFVVDNNSITWRLQTRAASSVARTRTINSSENPPSRLCAPPHHHHSVAVPSTH